MPQPFQPVVSRAVVLNRDDVDTDQIIPARFLTTVERTGLGRHLFADWRHDGAGGVRPVIDWNPASAVGAEVLVAGRNFGCGSSREHAPWALVDFGFRVIVARSFADIFAGNALKNGLLPVMLDDTGHRALLDTVSRAPETAITVDLESTHLSLPSGASWSFPVPPFARRCLLDGVDQLGFLCAAEPEIRAWELAHPSPVTTRSSDERANRVSAR